MAVCLRVCKKMAVIKAMVGGELSAAWILYGAYRKRKGANGLGAVQ